MTNDSKTKCSKGDFIDFKSCWCYLWKVWAVMVQGPMCQCVLHTCNEPKLPAPLPLKFHKFHINVHPTPAHPSPLETQCLHQAHGNRKNARCCHVVRFNMWNMHALFCEAPAVLLWMWQHQGPDETQQGPFCDFGTVWNDDNDMFNQCSM